MGQGNGTGAYTTFCDEYGESEKEEGGRYPDVPDSFQENGVWVRILKAFDSRCWRIQALICGDAITTPVSLSRCHRVSLS